ncbi:hypothetical protein AB2B46_17930 [Kluyvera intermedia]|uniref:hypothetical protein n=1 Tax=Kluyvera intermedia TaxID=61648 RepID=UPI0034A37A5D
MHIPPELVLPDTWTGCSIGLVVGVLLRYFVVRLFVVFRLFGREWSFDLKDRTCKDNHKDPS